MPPANERAPMMPAEAPMMAPQQGPLGGSMPAPPGAALPPQPQPYRQLKVEDALAYLDQVKMAFEGRPLIYNSFLDIMKDFKAQRLDTPGVVQQVVTLFKDDCELVLGFGSFLPANYRIEVQRGRVHLRSPSGSRQVVPERPAAGGLRSAVKRA